MALFSDYIKTTKSIFACDKCKKRFLPSEVKWMDPIDNCTIATPMMPFLYLDKDGKICGGNKMAQKSLGDKISACPHCSTIHLFGFDVVH